MFKALIKVFGKDEDVEEKKSGQIAKERLQNLLVSDRASMEQIQSDIIEVISKYTVMNNKEDSILNIV